MNETLINIITYILYIIALIIIVIFVLAIINYTLYTIYSIKEIVVHNTFEDAINYKLKDIYNYRLINYVNIINSDSNYNNNLFENVDKNDIRVIDMKNFTGIKISETTSNIVTEYIPDLSYLEKMTSKSDSNIIFELKNINEMKKRDFLEFYNLISFNNDNNENYIVKDKYFKFNNENYKIQYDYQKNLILPEFNINKSIYSDVVTTNQSDLSTNIVGKKIIGKNGVIYVYNDYNNDKYLKKSNNNGDIYGYILNGLYLLIPTSLLWSYDKYVTELYIITNNKLYEILLLLLFVILFIIFIAFIGDFYNFIFDNNDYKSEIFFVNKIIEKDAYLVIIIVSILAYCILHSIIYFFIFINGTYKKIKGIYDDLIIADEYVRYNVNNNLILQNYYNGSDIINAFTKIAYGDDINYMKGMYSVIDKTNNQDIYKTRADFEKKMLEINYSFSYKKDIYSQNSYSNTFFNKIYNILKIDIDATVATLTTLSSQQKSDIISKLKNIKKTLLFITILYIYFVNNNIDDPYILIKLNKLVFGRVANIGIKEIDDEIDFTLSFKSLLGHNLHKDELIKDLNNINTELFKYIEEYEVVKDDILVKLNNDSNPKDDLVKFQEKIYYIEKIDYWGAVYFFNLYLAIELILNAVIILLILMIIKYTNNEMRENVEKYIIIIGSILVLIIDEIKTAILGVV
jgi:hypothetical protein